MAEDHKKEKPKLMDCVLEAGAALIVLRHVAKSPEDAKKVNMEHTPACLAKCHADAVEKVDAAIEVLTDPKGPAIMTMRFGRGLRKLDDVWDYASKADGRSAYIASLEAHDAFERVLSAHGIATPTNQDIATRIALVNRR